MLFHPRKFERKMKMNYLSKNRGHKIFIAVIVRVPIEKSTIIL